MNPSVSNQPNQPNALAPVQPQTQPAAKPAPGGQAKAVPGGQAKAKILIADDDITLRDMYQARLETESYKVLVAADGEESLRVVRQEQPDLMLLDIMMPKMNGLDVLEAMKKDPEMRKIPVIVLTALIQDLTKVKSLMSGADDYLMKSEIMPGEVIKKVQETLAKAGKS